jgi:hypothetical protein
MMLVVCLASTVLAEGEMPGVTLDTTYVSKYIWHGFDLYGDHGAIQPSVDIDLWGSGFGVMVFHSRANRSGFRNMEEFNYIPYYSNSAFADSAWATDYSVSWLYYDYYDNKSSDADLQEVVLSFSWPNLPLGGIVPSYTTGKLWPTSSNAPGMRNIGGWVHVFGLGYDLKTSPIVPGTDEQVFSLIADLTYNDGYNGADVDHDWSHVTLGVSTSFDLGNNLTFAPAVYYQISMDDSVNDEDEVWTGLSLSYSF